MNLVTKNAKILKMEIDYNVPFFPNTADDTHCFQAVFKMLLKYFYPKESYSFEKLDKITAKKESLWTWPMAGVLWLKEKGLDLKVIEYFDYEKFARKGGRYIIEEYGEEVGNSQIAHSDIKTERRLAKIYAEKIEIEKRIAASTDIKDLLKQGYLVGCNVNSRTLNNKKGYSGHFVLIKGGGRNSWILHDPGSPAIENRKVGFRKFEKAWAFPNEKAKGLIGFKIQMKIDKEDQKLLALWAADCAEHVLHLFEENYPKDDRPRKAIEYARKWVATGILKMAEVRKAALDAHAAARKSTVPAATFAARAAGQAASVPHVAGHARAAASYALKTVENPDEEREWQYKHLAKHLRSIIEM